MRKIFTILAVSPIALWILSYMFNPSPEKISKAGELIAQTATPWWIPVIQFLVPLGIIGAIVIVALLFFVAARQI